MLSHNNENIFNRIKFHLQLQCSINLIFLNYSKTLAYKKRWDFFLLFLRFKNVFFIWFLKQHYFLLVYTLSSVHLVILLPHSHIINIILSILFSRLINKLLNKILNHWFSWCKSMNNWLKLQDTSKVKPHIFVFVSLDDCWNEC